MWLFTFHFRLISLILSKVADVLQKKSMCMRKIRVVYFRDVRNLSVLINCRSKSGARAYGNDCTDDRLALYKKLPRISKVDNANLPHTSRFSPQNISQYGY